MITLLPILALIIGPLDTAWWADDAIEIPGTTNLLTSLVAHWELEENDTDLRLDSHTGSFNFRPTPAGVSRIDDPKVGSFAASLEGDGNYLAVTNVVFDLTAESFSVSLWYKGSSSNFVIGQWPGSDPSWGWNVYVRTDSKVEFRILDEGTAELACSNSVAIDTGYHMITVTFDAISTDAVIYTDLYNETYTLNGLAAIEDTPLTIGNWMDGSRLNDSFYIDNLSFYTNRVLTSNEVYIRYNAGNGLAYPFE